MDTFLFRSEISQVLVSGKLLWSIKTRFYVTITKVVCKTVYFLLNDLFGLKQFKFLNDYSLFRITKAVSFHSCPFLNCLHGLLWSYFHPDFSSLGIHHRNKILKWSGYQGRLTFHKVWLSLRKRLWWILLAMSNIEN